MLKSKKGSAWICELFTIINLDHAHLFVDMNDPEQASNAGRIITSMIGTMIGEKVIDAIADQFPGKASSSAVNVVTRRDDASLRVLMVLNVSVVHRKHQKEVGDYLSVAFKTLSDHFKAMDEGHCISQVVTSVSLENDK